MSYVPGCGITQYTGNNHEVITLVSVGTYQLGTQSTRRMESLTLFDTLKSAAHILYEPREVAAVPALNRKAIAELWRRARCAPPVGCAAL